MWLLRMSCRLSCSLFYCKEFFLTIFITSVSHPETFTLLWSSTSVTLMSTTNVLTMPPLCCSLTLLSTSLSELHNLKNSSQPSLSPGFGTFLSTKEIKYWAVISENETWVSMADHENAEGPWITRVISLNHSHFTRPSMYSRALPSPQH